MANGPGLFSHRHPSTSSSGLISNVASTSNIDKEPEKVSPINAREHGLDCLRKIVNGAGASLSKTDVNKLATTLAQDPGMLKSVNLEDEVRKIFE